MTQRLRTFDLLLALLTFVLVTVTVSVRAVDDPHARTWIGATSGTNSVCLKCHATHKAAGSSLTNALGNESVCTSCHNLTGLASAFPLETFVKADPTLRLGTSHAWNVAADNASLGTQTPQSSVLSAHLDGGNVVCSTCHDQHASLPAAIAAGNAGPQRMSAASRIAGTGTGTVSSTATASASEKGYLLEIVETSGAAGVARFRLSNDGGLTWFGYSSGSWTAYATGNAAVTGTSVALNDGANVTATFTGDFVIGDRFRFYVAYPFLRVALDSGDNTTGDRFCRDCHRERAMDHTAINTWDGTMKSHPVGIVLNANGAGYDRAQPLAAGGAPQNGSGGSSDLKLAGDATVQCLTCHAVHHAEGDTP